MKALIIGLDGATFTVLRPLMEAGYLPNLQALVQRGASGALQSTIPPITALAWPTFMTGKNPGQHGLLSWQAPLNAQFERPLVNGRQIQGAKLWQLLGDQGLTVAVFNVPVTYPPEAVNGVLVAGMLTPSLNSQFTYPTALQAELLQRFPDYQTDIVIQNIQRHTSNLKAVNQFFAQAQTITRIRGEAFRWLLDAHTPDVAMIVFELPDRLQHILWTYIQALPNAVNDSTHAVALRDWLIQSYQLLDEEIGALFVREKAGPYIFILSDHGFGPLTTNVYLNDWLRHHGLLAYHQGRVSSWGLLRQIGKRFKRWIPGALIARGLQAVPLWKTIDWHQTKAYAGLPTEYGIFLNVAGREPVGQVQTADYEKVRQEIMTLLANWRDPQSGTLVMKAVYRREEIYRGPYVERAPDIVFELNSGYRISELAAPTTGMLLDSRIQDPLGWHEAEGVFVMAGPGIANHCPLTYARIEDVMPTLLYSLGLPIPDDVDGRVLLEAFEPPWQAEHPIRVQAGSRPNAVDEIDSGYSTAESQQLTKRLRDLGYLS
ncbi:MAG: alkaline phosphatase family protein [Caldilineaceae bacterium]